jgi:DNA-binding transcriptional LysR family regulator
VDARQLSSFLAVVEHGTVTRAASAVYVSQPALSQTIRALERELGTSLFHRIGRRLVLTAAGEAMVAPARQVVRDLELTRQVVADVTGVAGGTLDLAVLPTLAVDPAAALVGAFRVAHPAVTVRLVAPEGTADALARVSDGRVELAVTDAEAAPSLLMHELGKQEFRAVFAPGTAPGRRRTIKLAALAGVPMVTTPPGTSTRLVLERAVPDPVIAVECGPRDAILPLVVAGAGAALLPAPLADAAAAQGADVRQVEPPLSRFVTLVQRDAPLSPAAAAFVDIAVG